MPLTNRAGSQRSGQIIRALAVPRAVGLLHEAHGVRRRVKIIAVSPLTVRVREYSSGGCHESNCMISGLSTGIGWALHRKSETLRKQKRTVASVMISSLCG